MIEHPTINTDHYDLNREEYGSRRWANGTWKGVVAENRDPAGIGRLKIRIPQLQTDDQDIIDDYSLPWAYPMVLDPGAGTGSFDVPDKGAKVWVQFEQGDINHPVWFGGWVTQNSGPPPPSNPIAAPVKNAASKASDAASNVADAAKGMANAGQAASKATDAVSKAATGVQSAATKAAEAVAGLASGGASPSTSALSTAQNALSAATAAKDSASAALGKASDAHDAATSAAAGAIATANSAISILSDAKSSVTAAVSGVVAGADAALQTAVTAGQSVLSSITDITVSATNVNSFGGVLTEATGSMQTSALAVFQHATNIESTIQSAINSALGGYSTLNELAATMTNLTNLSQGLVNNVTSAIANLTNTVQGKIDSVFGAAKDLTAKANALIAIVKVAEGMVLERVNKIMGKKMPDIPHVMPNRPENFNNMSWPIGPGSEIPHEAQNMFANVPSVRLWKKSSKGHTLMCEDQDGKESMTHIDRAGNALYFNCPVDPQFNSGNMLFRKQRSTLTNDAVDRVFMRDGGSQVGLQDQAQSKIELDSRMGASKITIVANDGTGGIENGESRQKAEFMADAKVIIIESVKDGEVNAKVFIDANSGMVVVEAARFVNLHAPYVSINADHINLNGRVNVGGDMTISGRLTGGNK
jgi:phage baseplate assembly protein gpV